MSPTKKSKSIRGELLAIVFLLGVAVIAPTTLPSVAERVPDLIHPYVTAWVEWVFS